MIRRPPLRQDEPAEEMEWRFMSKGKAMAQSIRKFFGEKLGRKFLIFLEVLLAAAFLMQPHLYYDGTASTFFGRFYADSITICGGLWIILVFLTVKEVHFSEKLNRGLSWAAAFLTPLAALFWGPLDQIPALYLFLDLVIYYVIYLFLLLIFNSIRGASAAMIVATAFFGIMNYELTVFRSMSFIASDIYSFFTALSVANTYQPEIDVDTAEFFLLALVLLALLFKLKKFRLFRWKARTAFAAAFTVAFMGFCQVYVFSDYLENIGVDFRVYRPQYKYRYYGTLLTTIRTFGYLHVTEPEGYSVDAVQEITSDYVASEESLSGTAVASAGRKSSDGMSDSLHLLAHPEVSAAETKGDRDAARQKSSGSKAESADSAKDARKQADGSKAGKKSSSGKKGQKPNIIAIMNESFSVLVDVIHIEVLRDGAV